MYVLQLVGGEEKRNSKKLDGRLERMIKNQVMVKLDVPLTLNKSDALSTKEGRQSGLEKSVLSNTRWRQGLECTTHFSEAFLRQLLAATG